MLWRDSIRRGRQVTMSEIMDRFFAAVAGRYRIERDIGSGGMATVYLARDLKHDRDVAVKVLRPELAAVLGINRFLNEIRISARLDHPHILTLIDSGVVDGFPYYVMPFVRGESLRAKLEREKQLGMDEALDIARQVMSALDYAHRHGIVHRDIKPENILIHEGEAMLSDFGIATAVREAGGSRLTESGVSLGTPQYMSPEQASGDRVLDARSDVYSIAAVLYEMLAGEPPHTGATVQAVIAKLLTERPTRLRVIRDTVPEAVDSAVAKALAKLPADRYASAGDFARALVTGAPRERASAAWRRWIPLALGGSIIAAVAIAAFTFGRKPAPRPSPDTVQLTVSGNAIAPSLSPDGTRLAFGEKQCDSVGSCNYQLVIQDIDGTSRSVLVHNLGYVYRTQWMAGGRFLEFSGSYPPLRHGAFVVPTLGGEPRYLGPGTFDVQAGDTGLLADRAWVRRITVHDGQTIDSIRNPGPGYHPIALSIPDRLLAQIEDTSGRNFELRLMNFRGQVISRRTPPFGLLQQRTFARWIPSRQKLLIAYRRELGGAAFDMLTMNVTASEIASDVDTVLSDFELGSGLGSGITDNSADGKRLVYSAGPVETSLSMIDVDRRQQRRLVANQLRSTTTRLRGRISPAGDRMLLASDAPRGAGRTSQFSIIPLNGSAESQLPGAVENLLDFKWSTDGARIMYLHEIDRDSIALIERDTTGRVTHVIAHLEQPAATEFGPLADGAAWIMPADRHSISIIRRLGKPDVTWQVPEWIIALGGISHSPDAKSLVVEGLKPLGDSVVVATVDIETGRFTRIGGFAGSDPIQVAWLEDGATMSIFREPQGAWALYRIPRGLPPQRLGFLPHTRADFTVSKDGKHVAMFRYVDKNDVYMIRNFGELLRR